MFKKTIGTSVNGSEIIAQSNFDLSIKPQKSFTLIIGGMHGNERAPVPMLENFISQYMETSKITNPVSVITILNPDGYKTNTRFNAKGIDLNRNFPYNWSKESEEPSGPSPLSEPESLALYKFILKYCPAIIVNLHCALSEIDADGEQSVNCVKNMWNALSKKEQKRYRLTTRTINKTETVSCPGSLGQFCGYDLFYKNKKQPAMITLELPYTHENKKSLYPLPENSFDIMVDHWKKHPLEYLEVIEPSVHKLLCVACEL